MSFFSDIFGGIKDFVGGIMDVVMTPFKAIMGTITDQAKDQVAAITDAVGDTGIGSLAQGAVDSVGGALGGVLDTAEGVVDRGSDSLFGTLDVMKYIPYVVLGFGGLFALKYGSEIISETGRTARRD